MATDFLITYRQQAAKRALSGLPPLPLSVEQVSQLTELMQNPSLGKESSVLLEYLSQQVLPGVNAAAHKKAVFLSAVAKGQIKTPALTPLMAISLLGSMLGGYNIALLIELLDASDELAEAALAQLASSVLLFNAYHDVVEKYKLANPYAARLLKSWAAADWFTARPKIPNELILTVLKVPGEITTDDLSPATEVWNRSDIPLHAQSLLRARMPEALQTIRNLKQKGHPIALVGDIIGTGNSKKSAIDSLLWHIGEPIPFVPNKKQGGVIIGGKMAPSFYKAAENAGALPIEADVSHLSTGDSIKLFLYEGCIARENGQTVAQFKLAPNLLNALRTGGRLQWIIGRSLTDSACQLLKRPLPAVFHPVDSKSETAPAYTLAQKIVGKACGVKGIQPGTYCEPRISSVGSQDTAPIIHDELKDLTCLGFSVDLVLQSFCHHAPYSKATDLQSPNAFARRGSIVLRPGDGVIYPWLNRMLLPDEVGTGGDPRARFPLGISFPERAGLVAFAATTGVMPLTMPESVLVRFKGKLQPGITLRDLVHAIPYFAAQKGLLTTDNQNKLNVFAGRILEIEGLADLSVEQAFEFSDASAERLASACTVRLDLKRVIEYLRSNISLLSWMVHKGYQDTHSLKRRIQAMESWLKAPHLLEPDADAVYSAIIEIDLAEIKEPLLACPNSPNDIRPLSELAQMPVDEVFIGSCMTNIGHYRAAGYFLKQWGKRVPIALWISPPTKMDMRQLMAEGYYAIYGLVGARTEMPGCSLCMGNQARVTDNMTVVSTASRYFPSEMGKGANVYLASAELSAITAILGRLPTANEYKNYLVDIQPLATDIYRHLDFDKMPEYAKLAEAA